MPNISNSWPVPPTHHVEPETAALYLVDRRALLRDDQRMDHRRAGGLTRPPNRKSPWRCPRPR